jgi:hypothetical protein
LTNPDTPVTTTNKKETPMAIVILPHHKPIPALYADTHALRHRGIAHTRWKAILYRWPRKPQGQMSLPYALRSADFATGRLPHQIHHHQAYYYWLIPLNHDYLTVRISPQHLRRDTANYADAAAHHIIILGCAIKIHTGKYGILSKIKGIRTHWATPQKHQRWK